MVFFNDKESEIKTFVAKARQWSFFAGKSTMFLFEINPNEGRPVEVEFKDDMITGATLDSENSAVTAVDSSGTDKTSTIISGKSVVKSTKLRCKVAAATAGEDYIITFKAVTEVTGYIYIQKVLLQCRQETISAA